MTRKRQMTCEQALNLSGPSGYTSPEYRAQRDRLNDAVNDAVGKLVAACDEHDAHVANGDYRKRDRIITAAYALKDAYDKRAQFREVGAPKE